MHDMDGAENTNRKKKLIVEDEKDKREALFTAMAAEGFEVHVAKDGEEALAMTLDCNPHIVISDWNMPGMTGIDLLKAVRSDPGLSGLPVLMVTAESKRDQIIEAAQAGVNG